MSFFHNFIIADIVVENHSEPGILGESYLNTLIYYFKMIIHSILDHDTAVLNYAKMEND